MPKFNKEILSEFETMIMEELDLARNGARLICPDEPEFNFHGDGPESEGVGHDYKVVRARMQETNPNRILACGAALMRIENDVFGICAKCGEDIPEKRLRSFPTTPFCVECKIELGEENARPSLPEIGNRREVSYIRNKKAA